MTRSSPPANRNEVGYSYKQTRKHWLETFEVFSSRLVFVLSGFLYHPATARFIATIAELLEYNIWAEWVGKPYWTHSLGWICIFGAVVSWTHLLFQSEALGITEDSCWTLHASLMFICKFLKKTQNSLASLVIFTRNDVASCSDSINTLRGFETTLLGTYSAYLLIFHLPRQMKRIGKKPTAPPPHRARPASSARMLPL